MRVVLISPAPASYLWRKKRAAFTLPPMALPLLAAVTPPGVEIRLVDEAVEDVDLNLEADLVGLSVMTATAPRAYKIADHFRSRGIQVVMGGVHPSCLPEEALQHSDAVVMGEGENHWAGVVEAMPEEGASSGSTKRHPLFPWTGCPLPGGTSFPLISISSRARSRSPAAVPWPVHSVR
jgi:radical SAM superfamily enzyme YgiQ (UPF0313 family)